jgi:hypothetical protein
VELRRDEMKRTDERLRGCLFGRDEIKVKSSQSSDRLLPFVCRAPEFI